MSGDEIVLEVWKKANKRSFCSLPLSKWSNPVARIYLTTPSSIVINYIRSVIRFETKSYPHTWSVQRILIFIVFESKESMATFALSMMYLLMCDLDIASKMSRFPGHLPWSRGICLAPIFRASCVCRHLLICTWMKKREGIEKKQTIVLMIMFKEYGEKSRRQIAVAKGGNTNIGRTVSINNLLRIAE